MSMVMANRLIQRLSRDCVPIKEHLVLNAEDYPYSSARDYAGEKGLLDVILVDV